MFVSGPPSVTVLTELTFTVPTPAVLLVMALSSGFAPPARFTIVRVPPVPTATVFARMLLPRELASAAVPTCRTPPVTLVPPL